MSLLKSTQVLLTLFNISPCSGSTISQNCTFIYKRSFSLPRTSAYMTLLPETLCRGVYMTEKVMEPSVEILIAILALSSLTDLPRIVRGRLFFVGREKCEIYGTRLRFISATLNLDRMNRVAKMFRAFCSTKSKGCQARK